MAANIEIPDLRPGEFIERRKKAQQSGTPAWLWPEVPLAAWFEALADIRQAISRVLDNKPARLSSSHRQALSVACYTAGVGPLLGLWAKEGKLSASADIAQLLASHLQHARARQTKVRRKAKRTVSALTGRGIPVIVLKGADTAYRHFEAPETRPASDLDLLVPLNRGRAAEAVLAESGLALVGRGARDSSWADAEASRDPKSLWLVHRDDPWSVDLHSSLDFAACPGAAVVGFDRTDPFASTEPWVVEPSAKVLSQPLLLLHLAVHASGGLHSLTMLRMVELVLVIRKDLAAKRLSWDEFTAVGAHTGALGAAFPALRMCDMLAPGTVPPKVLTACAQAMPRRARKVAEQLEPGTAHRVDRASVAEHFMWVTGAGGWFRQLRSDLLPGAASLRRIYGARFYGLLRGRITR